MRTQSILAIAAWAMPLSLGGCGDDTISRAETAMRNTLKDPDSAQFKDVERCGNGAMVKGSVNAKNNFGAYTGFEEFYSDGQTGATEAAQFDEFIGLARRCTAEILNTIPKPRT